MRIDKFTSKFQQALSDAQSLAVSRDHSLIEPAHLLLALIDQQGGNSLPVLRQAGVMLPYGREQEREAGSRKATTNIRALQRQLQAQRFE